MTFEEAFEATVTREEAIREIHLHDADPTEFLDEVGDRNLYNGSEVLAWLGY